ncbi:MAG: helix-turn-helix domain-containing protein [Rhodobacteraceae bacterium]|uniref:DNA-binding protein n=1 Tax=Roseovarius nubinhibens TaxID=314263 RepID=A0A348W783_9RHOB|nr:helix-turn-helix domain-containing protein [Paracoccaceae bacterium]HAR50395.1 DNA-binding protein [Roseovarius nubinhibens]|tara:strand:+ start:10717 stop:10953 length:237 start_codon:yes stop_codon:yes gene_type:complete
MTHDFTPRLMAARAAAKFLGISESKLRTLAIPRKTFGGNVVWDRADLDAYADSLPYEGGEGLATWDNSGEADDIWRAN